MDGLNQLRYTTVVLLVLIVLSLVNFIRVQLIIHFILLFDSKSLISVFISMTFKERRYFLRENGIMYVYSDFTSN